MYPGATTRLSHRTVASAATLVADKDVLFLTGTTGIDTFTPKSPNKSGMAQILWVVPTAGNVAVSASGNVATAQTMLDKCATVFIWNPSTSKWYPHALA